MDSQGWQMHTGRRTRTMYKIKHVQNHEKGLFVGELYNRALLSLTFIHGAVVVTDL